MLVVMLSAHEADACCAGHCL